MTSRSLHRGILSFPVSLREKALRRKLCISIQLRHYAAKRTPPRFDGGGRPSNPEEVFRDLKRKYPKAPSPKEDANPPPSKGIRKYGITPMRVVLLSIFSFLGYKYWGFRERWNERSLIMNGRFFAPFLLESKDQVSSTSSIFNLMSIPAGGNVANIEDAWKLGVWSVQALKPDLQIARSYTPLPPNERTTAEQVRLLIRKEPEGMVSTFLHRQPPSMEIQLRGPHVEYVIPEDVDEILFLAGGTGIAPALQVAHCLYNVRETSASRKPKVHVLWANRRREDSFSGFAPTSTETLRTSVLAKIQAGWDFNKPGPSTSNVKFPPEIVDSQGSLQQSPLIKEVEAMKIKSGEKFSVDYFVDEDNTFITEGILQKHLNGSDATQKSTASGKKLVILAGPDGFVNAYAGPKGMYKGKATQGPIGGVLERIGHEEWDIWKL